MIFEKLIFSNEFVEIFFFSVPGNLSWNSVLLSLCLIFGQLDLGFFHFDHCMFSLLKKFFIFPSFFGPFPFQHYLHLFQSSMKLVIVKIVVYVHFLNFWKQVLHWGVNNIMKLLKMFHNFREDGRGFRFRILVRILLNFEEGENFGVEFEVSFDRKLVFFNFKNVI